MQYAMQYISVCSVLTSDTKYMLLKRCHCCDVVSLMCTDCTLRTTARYIANSALLFIHCYNTVCRTSSSSMDAHTVSGHAAAAANASANSSSSSSGSFGLLAVAGSLLAVGAVLAVAAKKRVNGRANGRGDAPSASLSGVFNTAVLRNGSGYTSIDSAPAAAEA
jgi:hypothetical protein